MKWSHAAAAAVVTVAVFLPSLGGGFVYDDRYTLAALEGPEPWTFALTDTYGFYIPLTWLTLAVDYSIWHVQPFGYHLTNVLLHGANAALLCVLLHLLLRRVGIESPWAAVGGALLYSLHPLRVESVAWVTERRDVLCGLFTLLTLIAYVRGRVWVALPLFAAALLSKTMVLGLPIVLLALDAFPLRRRAFVEKIPFFVLAAAAAVLQIYCTSRLDPFYEFTSVDRVFHPTYRLGFYAVKTVWPIGLSPLYPYRASEDWWNPWYHAALAGGIAATLLALRRRPALVGWVSFVVLLAPVLGVAQAGPHFAADRYTYFASLAWAPFAAAWLAKRPWIALAPIALFAALSIRQTAHWKSELTLWTRVVEVEPNPFGYHNLGVARSEAGDHAGAVAAYDRAIAMEPAYSTALASRGFSKWKLGDVAGARADYDASIAVQENPDAYFFRALLPGSDREGDLRRALEVAAEDWARRAEVRRLLPP